MTTSCSFSEEARYTMQLDEATVARTQGWSGPQANVADVVSTFQHWLYLPDPSPLLAVLGAVAANRLEGDPVWLVLVGPPGGGKSELLTAVGSLDRVHPTGTLTEAALLSGTPKREVDTDAKGGLLRAIGDDGLILCKDFGSVLSMNRDARAAVLAALREVYDGSWTRHVGTDGGKTLHWSGKVGLLAGCTPSIDRHHAVMGAMGERFVLFRLPQVDVDEQTRRAISHAGSERAMRKGLTEVVAALFNGDLSAPRSLSEEETKRLVMLATLVVRCRSAVERDGYQREIELIPEPEAPTRLAVVLERFLAGLDSIGVERSAAWDVVCRAALDSVPALRRAVMDALMLNGGGATGPKLAEALGYPTTTTRRTLEELVAHRIVTSTPYEQGRAYTYALDPWARERYAVARGSSDD
jgi:hypothetical protein